MAGKKKKSQKQKSSKKSDKLKNILNKAINLHERGSFQKSLDLVLSEYEDTLNKNQEIFSRLCLTGVSSAYQLGKYPQALDLIDNNKDIHENCLDFQLFAALNLFEMAEYQQCLDITLPIFESFDPALGLKGTFINLNELVSQLYHCAAMSHYNLKNFSLAENILRQAIDVNPNFQLFYLDLVQIKKATKDIDGERAAISEGLVKCAYKDELNKLADKFLGDESISLCMIVKNEEEMLSNCLSSVKDFVDELIIVDTGSTDKTVEIAESFGAKIYHHAWENDFSLHRNQSISHATSDWIMILDADEELVSDDLEKIRQCTRIPDINVLSLTVNNIDPKINKITSFLPSMRMWRRNINAVYEGIVHNELRFTTNEQILRLDARINHYGYSLDKEKMKQKIARSKPLLLKQIAENPDNAFAHYNYSQLLMGEDTNMSESTCKQIIEHSSQAVELTNPELKELHYIHLMALNQLVTANFYLKQYEQAEEYALKALEIKPDYIDPLYSLGHIYASQNEFDKAIKAHWKYLDMVEKYNPGNEVVSLIYMHLDDTISTYYSLGLIHQSLDETERALEYFNIVCNRQHDYRDVLSKISELHLNSKNIAEAKKYAQECLQSQPQNEKALSILLEIAFEEEEYEQVTTACEDFLKHSPENSNIINDLGNCYFKQADYQLAIDYYENALAINPQQITARRNVGLCYFKLNKLDEAIDHIRNYLKIVPDDLEILLLAVKINQDQQNYNKVVECLEEVVTIQPSAEMITMLADGYLQLGHFDSAKAGYLNVLKYYHDYKPAKLKLEKLEQEVFT